MDASSRRPRVLVTVPWPVTGLHDRVEIVRGTIEENTTVDALLIGPTDPLGSEMIATMPNLRAVAVAGGGLDAVDVESLAERGIHLVSAPEPTAQPTAELAIALMLMVSRGIPASIEHLRAGDWHGWSFDAVAGRGLSGLTLGLVGFGRIGREVARLARPFGMRVLHHCRTASGVDGFTANLHEMLAASDIVSLHVPLNSTTRGMIGAAEISEMPVGSVIVNTSRGGVLDESALVAALGSGHLAGAGLDVFSAEPGIPHTLIGVPNVVLTPHIGTATNEARTKMIEDAAAKLLVALGV